MSAAVGVRWGAVLGVCTGWSGEDSESRARGRCAGGSAASQVEGAASAKALRQWCAWFCAQQQKKAMGARAKWAGKEDRREVFKEEAQVTCSVAGVS